MTLTHIYDSLSTARGRCASSSTQVNYFLSKVVDFDRSCEINKYSYLEIWHFLNEITFGGETVSASLAFAKNPAMSGVYSISEPRSALLRNGTLHLALVDTFADYWVSFFIVFSKPKAVVASRRPSLDYMVGCQTSDLLFSSLSLLGLSYSKKVLKVSLWAESRYEHAESFTFYILARYALKYPYPAKNMMRKSSPHHGSAPPILRRWR